MILISIFSLKTCGRESCLNSKNIIFEGFLPSFFMLLKGAILTICSQFVYKKLIDFSSKILKKLLHFAHIYSIIVMRRGEKSHESD